MFALLQFSIMVLMVLSLLGVTPASEDDDDGLMSVQIVLMAKSHESAASHLDTLASVLGSQSAAKKAIIYDYTRSVNGFAAKLTVGQIRALLKHPEVLQILPGGPEIVGDISSIP